MIANGWSTKMMASELAETEGVVNGVVRELLLRSGVRNRAHLIGWAFREGHLQNEDVRELPL